MEINDQNVVLMFRNDVSVGTKIFRSFIYKFQYLKIPLSLRISDYFSLLPYISLVMDLSIFEYDIIDQYHFHPLKINFINRIRKRKDLYRTMLDQ